MAENDHFIVVGKISAPFGVKGWVKVHSYTEFTDGILDYSPWWIKREGQWQQLKLEAAKLQGKWVVAHIEGVMDRDQAQLLKGSEIGVTREQLPPPEDGEYYWVDLIGLEVRNLDDVSLGVVRRLLETGANDVLVVYAKNTDPGSQTSQESSHQERLIPYVPEVVVKDVNLEQGYIRVDWDTDF
ncbi:MAG: ribosome maturation factor RimM [Gammaproteobacteria bacterium]|nr:ribosome maturation factor RimM [Gammaproteobacteria bacterium]MDH5801070.1 ribosome maturation factor RimM [Gammaproteobacteria bacterium]